MKGLDLTDIQALMATSRSRNTYGPKLMEFIESDEAAIDVAEVWPTEFGGKESTTLYQGFTLAARKAEVADTVAIKNSDGHCYILHNERVKLISQNGNAPE